MDNCGIMCAYEHYNRGIGNNIQGIFKYNSRRSYVDTNLSAWWVVIKPLLNERGGFPAIVKFILLWVIVFKYIDEIIKYGDEFIFVVNGRSEQSLFGFIILTAGFLTLIV